MINPGFKFEDEEDEVLAEIPGFVPKMVKLTLLFPKIDQKLLKMVLLTRIEEDIDQIASEIEKQYQNARVDIE